ncbi:hypothetical protein NP493_851g00026 [Ridgeia piscesae]|uniref:SAM domain-containing protein n=1 Tax=Ridgeia piscesae TaxID=27915 RepID=A0AAD9NKU1_RIDPI|nr:hypothetical protein NP493_851g00026 [Ridgeia piscesae]
MPRKPQKTENNTTLSVNDWTSSDVAVWLNKIGFQVYVDLFCDQHRIDGKALLTLSEQDLRMPPLEVNILGDIKRLMIEIRKLQSKNQSAIEDLGFSASMSSLRLLNSYGRVPRRHNSSVSTISDYDDYMDPHMYSHKLKPEYIKLFISFTYMVLVFWCTAFTMVVAHDRVPDMQKYPPLPDLFLDNMPYVPWAFDMCEMTALCLGTITIVVLIFHKHRFIIMRRLFAMSGTVFMLRCITMFITSLSVPGTHLDCHPRVNDDVWAKLNRALLICRGFGMSLQGVRSCGDYMFSGHTVIVTMLNFFNTEYIPHRLHYIHIASWVMNMFSIFFILAAHEHYSIDVFIGFYITSRLFLYYHSLANNRVLKQPDHMRTRIWFPMFSFFESSIDGVVPNEYEWPLPWPQSWKLYFDKKKHK